MDWKLHFQTFFFEAWQKAGLPYYQNYLSAYYQIVQQQDEKNEWINHVSAISPGINQMQLYGVYNFGVLVGTVFSEMLGLDLTKTKHVSDWCGRFNLGISLFDYICDEMEGANSVSSLQVFQTFAKTHEPNNRTLTPAEELVSRLAGSVLNDLKKASEKSRRNQQSDPLFKMMQQLFDAQNFISKEKLSAGVDLKKIKKALYSKSAGPFIVMAMYAATMATERNELLTKNAHAIGKAIGYCYWLIDDVKDVFVDIEAGQWNLFLQLAATVDAELFATKTEANINARLLRIWKESKHAEKISNQVIKRLVNATKRLNLSEKAKSNSLGFVSASLWHWYHA